MTTQKVFTFFQDPGHGWIRVSPADCADVGLSADSFTRYSYRDANFFYLEEDCDASRFAEAYQAKHGCQLRIKDSHRNSDSPIRRLARLNMKAD